MFLLAGLLLLSEHTSIYDDICRVAIFFLFLYILDIISVTLLSELLHFVDFIVARMIGRFLIFVHNVNFRHLDRLIHLVRSMTAYDQSLPLDYYQPLLLTLLISIMPCFDQDQLQLISLCKYVCRC